MGAADVLDSALNGAETPQEARGAPQTAPGVSRDVLVARRADLAGDADRARTSLLRLEGAVAVIDALLDTIDKEGR